MTNAGRRLAAVVVSSTLAVGALSCNTNRVAGAGLLEPGGRVLLSTSGREPATVARARPLKDGDTVEVVEGTAKLTLPGGEVLELRPRSILALRPAPELRSGDLLVTSSTEPKAANVVRAAGSEVAVAGSVRITLAPSLRVVTYRGSSTLRSGGRELEVPALRSADVSLIGLLPGRPSPIVLDRADPWVGRFLNDALEAEAALESRSRGFTSQVSARDAGAPAFYRGLLPGLANEPDFDQAVVDRFGRAQPSGPVRAGEVLIGSAIARQGVGRGFAERLAAAAAFRAEGATWAVVAVDQQVQIGRAS